MRLIWRIVWTGIAGFFLAGAVVFPLLVPYYQVRVLSSLGMAAVLYGIDSVLHFGLVHTSGLMSGSESVHSVRIYGVMLWIGLFAYSVWRERRQAQAEWQQWADAAAEAEAEVEVKALPDNDEAQRRS